ncbi:hypothetical protein [Cupriavidus malaysiensis]|uniref:DUF3168 domain-containing protein n=1 Tax=Cupriavidus malaysiensis TaxID=367825 RepID=A0ABN4TFN7_9BURK|nr:hypothetical protein [Cupriavidus malaysiensis]AOZ05962.1 hypothetical protein BKK80_09070 [Cupriavidus malaysiensis]
MSTVHERVYAAAVAAVAGEVPPAGVVAVHDRLRLAEFSVDELPAVRVLPGTDLPVDGISDWENVNELTVEVQLLMAGVDQIASMPQLHAEIHRRVWADPTLGGLAVRPFNGAIDERREESDQLRILKTYRYRWRYRVAADDATAIP